MRSFNAIELAAAFPQILETAFSEIDVFKLVKVAENRLSRINLFVRPVRLASSASSRFDFRRKAKSEHECLQFAIYS